jgi:capsular exopolysaccharide synthesis family protein
MSRFYDVLKASRSQPGDGKPDRTIRETVHDSLEESTQANQPDALSTQSISEMVTPLAQESEPKGATPWQNGAGAGRALLDRKARLIPNTADLSIVEHYRRLRTKLLQENEVRPFRLLMIASLNPHEGKTLTAMNLALSFAMLPSCKVLIIDGDLRKGTLSKWLCAHSRPGLSNLIDGTAEIANVVVACDNVAVQCLPRGHSKTPAGELLNSSRLNDYLRQMAEWFDVVLVDSPPLNIVTDAQLLARCCDGVLLVTRAFSTTRKSLERAVQDLQPFRVLGTVLNGAVRAKNYRKYVHYYRTHEGGRPNGAERNG